MSLHRTILFALVASLGAALPVSGDDWDGAYFGLHLGEVSSPDDNNDVIRFDTDLDGSAGDTVRTAAGADAFSPGFCDGVAQDRTPAGGCAGNSGGADWGLRAGYDWDRGGLVYGFLVEYARDDARDAVSAFSTTPARYMMLRKVDDTLALRGRIGFKFGDGRNLVYGTAGYARANVDVFFDTSNGVNTFVSSGGGSTDGIQYGIGIERRFWSRVSLGLEYLHTDLDDEGHRVRAQGPAPATNPFLIVNPAGTDFIRSDADDFDLDSWRLTASYRF